LIANDCIEHFPPFKARKLFRISGRPFGERVNGAGRSFAFAPAGAFAAITIAGKLTSPEAVRGR
jgi:hypothetical protein